MHFSRTFILFGQAAGNYLLLALACYVLANLLSFAHSLLKKKKFMPITFTAQSILMTGAFAFLGFAIGLLVGRSMSPVIGVTVPALLTFYGGFLTFLFAKDQFKNDAARMVVVTSVMSVSVFLLYGVEIGIKDRIKSQKIERLNDIYFLYREEEIKKAFR